MRQIDLKTLFLNSRSPADTFWYLGGAPTTNIQSYTAFESKMVDDHFDAILQSKHDFLWKIEFWPQNGRQPPYFQTPYSSENWSLEHLQGIKKYLRDF